MDRTSTWLIRVSLLWLVSGATAGAVMMSDAYVPGAWRVWLGPAHGHALFVGWFLQFTLGVAIWLLPRQRTSSNPIGYRESSLWAAMALLNSGLLLRMVAEPIQRSGRTAGWLDPALAASGALQLTGLAIIAIHIWPRVATRARRPNPISPDRTTSSSSSYGE